MELTNNFTLSEFDCNEGSKVPKELVPNVLELAKNLQVLREVLGCPININSAYRTEPYNRDVGGGLRSQHLLAKAADISCSKYPPNIVHDLIEELIRCGDMKQGGLGLYNTFLHYDIRGTKARWDYSDRF